MKAWEETWMHERPGSQEILTSDGVWLARFSPAPGSSPDREADRARLAAAAPEMARLLLGLLEKAERPYPDSSKAGWCPVCHSNLSNVDLNESVDRHGRDVVALDVLDHERDRLGRLAVAPRLDVLDEHRLTLGGAEDVDGIAGVVDRRAAANGVPPCVLVARGLASMVDDQRSAPGRFGQRAEHVEAGADAGVVLIGAGRRGAQRIHDRQVAAGHDLAPCVGVLGGQRQRRHHGHREPISELRKLDPHREREPLVSAAREPLALLEIDMHDAERLRRLVRAPDGPMRDQCEPRGLPRDRLAGEAVAGAKMRCAATGGEADLADEVLERRERLGERRAVEERDPRVRRRVTPLDVAEVLVVRHRDTRIGLDAHALEHLERIQERNDPAHTALVGRAPTTETDPSLPAPLRWIRTAQRGSWLIAVREDGARVHARIRLAPITKGGAA